MILHDVHYQSFDLRQADTLESPQHQDQVFEAIVANPPFRLNGLLIRFYLMTPVF